MAHCAVIFAIAQLSCGFGIWLLPSKWTERLQQLHDYMQVCRPYCRQLRNSALWASFCWGYIVGGLHCIIFCRRNKTISPAKTGTATDFYCHRPTI